MRVDVLLFYPENSVNEKRSHEFASCKFVAFFLHVKPKMRREEAR